MADNTPQSREEALLQNILGAQNELGIPQSRIEKIWQYALKVEGVTPEPAQSRIEVLAIQVAEAVRSGGGSEPTGTINITANGEHNVKQYATADVAVHDIEDGMIDRTISGAYVNPRVDKVGQYTFHSRNQLTSVKFENVTAVGTSSFYSVTSLISAELPSCASINNDAFRGCSALELLNLYSPNRDSIPTLGNSTVFNGTPIAAGTGHVVINDEMVSTLSAASNWSLLPSGVIIGHTTAVQQGIITA